MNKDIDFFVDGFKNSHESFLTIKSLLVDVKKSNIDIKEVGTSGLSILDTLIYYNILSPKLFNAEIATGVLLHLAIGFPIKSNLMSFFDKDVLSHQSWSVNSENFNTKGFYNKNITHFLSNLDEYEGYKETSDRLKLLLLFKVLFHYDNFTDKDISNDSYEKLQVVDYSFIAKGNVLKASDIPMMVKTLGLDATLLRREMIKLNAYYQNNLPLEDILKDLQGLGMIDMKSLNVLRVSRDQDISDIQGNRLVSLGEVRIKEEFYKTFDNVNGVIRQLYNSDGVDKTISKSPKDLLDKKILKGAKKIEELIVDYGVSLVNYFKCDNKPVESIKGRIIALKNELADQIKYREGKNSFISYDEQEDVMDMESIMMMSNQTNKKFYKKLSDNYPSIYVALERGFLKPSVVMALLGLDEVIELTGVDLWVKLEESIGKNNQKILNGEMTITGEKIDAIGNQELVDSFNPFSQVVKNVDITNEAKKYSENTKNIITFLNNKDYINGLNLLNEPYAYRNIFERLLPRLMDMRQNDLSCDDFYDFFAKNLTIFNTVNSTLLLDEDGLKNFNGKTLRFYIDELNDYVFKNKISYENYAKIVKHSFFKEFIDNNQIEVVLKENIPAKISKAKPL